MTCTMKVRMISISMNLILGANDILTGEGKFDDDHSNKPSGAATPVPGAAEGPPSKKKKTTGKKAKTLKQRLAIADGDVDGGMAS
jgi:DNA helicase INO80